MKAYKRPPVVEAVIGINFDTSLENKHIEKISKSFKNYFQAPHFQVEATMTVTEKGFTTSQKEEKGVKLQNLEKLSTLIVLPRSMIASTFPPYSDWSQLFNSFRELWEIMQETSHRRKLRRIGCRYINRIDIPLNKSEDRINIAEYVTFGIQTPPDVNIHSYDAGIIVYINDQFQAKVSTATVPNVVPSTAALLLDIDIWTENYSLESDEKFYELLQEMRRQKNYLFEKFITDATRDLFNKDVA